VYKYRKKASYLAGCGQKCPWDMYRALQKQMRLGGVIMKRGKRLLAMLLCVIVFVSMMSTVASAASYPLISAKLESAKTIPQGEIGILRFMIFPEFKNEQYHVEIYNSYGTKIGSVDKQYYNASTGIKDVLITVNTNDLNMGVGTYTIKYWTSFYSLYSWHDSPSKYTYTLQVITNKCKNNHNLVVDDVVSEATCSKKGTVKVSCTKCDYWGYQEQYGEHTYGSWTKVDDASHQRTCTACSEKESESHSFNAGVVTKEPTCSTTGIKTYTCNTCGGTKTETVAKTNDHIYGNWNKQDDSTHKRTCNLCGKTESASHSWNGGTITKQPTCAATGIKTYTCNICGGTKTQTLAKTTDHTYGFGTKVDDNSHRHSCETCGQEETVSHVWDSGRITLAPTLEATGLREYSCKECTATKTEIVPKRASGDLNGDQKVDNKDVAYLLWHTLFPTSYPLEMFADFDFSNTVDNKDVEYLLWHTLFPDRYPLHAK